MFVVQKFFNYFDNFAIFTGTFIDWTQKNNSFIFINKLKYKKKTKTHLQKITFSFVIVKRKM